MKICFATEVTYPNYVNRIKNSSLKFFLEKNLDKLDIYYYISTNLPNNFTEYSDNDKVRVFDIEELRKNHNESKEYELLPDDPTGLYPSRYPWNLRRFIIEKAAFDGFDYVIYVDADNVFRQHLSGEDILNSIKNNFEANTVKTNSTIFKYINKTPDDVFNYHENYIKHFGLSFETDDYDTLDGPCQVFIGKTNLDIIRLMQYWHQFTYFGYKKEFGYGYGNNKHGNLSFVIPISGFKLKWCDYPLYPNHVYEDRYTYSNPFNKQIDSNINEISKETLSVNQNNEDKPLSFFLNQQCSDKVSSRYHLVYDNLFEPIKNNHLNLLEIGIGTTSTTPLEGMNNVPSTMAGWKDKNPSYSPGSSLRAFRDYFKNGNIYGVDIQPDCIFEEDRIKTFIVDSSNKEKCDSIFSDEFFQIIIDDGNHDPDFQIKTLNVFFSKLSKEGFYIIEDVVDMSKLKNFLDTNGFKYETNNHNLIVINKKDSITIENIETPVELTVEKKIEFKNVETDFKINGIKLADRGFFINLPESTDRLSLVVEQIKKYNIEGLNRFEALTDEWRHFSCTKSHLKVFENSLLDDLEIIFVAEDDFMIEEKCYFPNGEPKDFLKVISDVAEDLKSVEWDVLLFGCNPKGPLIPLTNNLALVNKSTGAWAYLIKKRAYRYLLKHSDYKKDLIAIDDYLPLLNDRGFTTITTIPLSINHGVNLVSTLQPAGIVNYDTWIKGSYHKFLYDLHPDNDFTKNSFEKEVTIVIVGHFVENFLFYLRYLLHSLPDVLKKCKILINYDESGVGEINTHKVSLNAFFRDVVPNLNFSVTYSNGGLISSLKNCLSLVKTKYMIFLEHDWVFLKKDNINFESLKQAFNNHDFINAVWFAKDDNTMRGFEICRDKTGKTTPFEKENRVSECDLVTTCRWSNNPVMFRTEKMRYWFENIINNEYVDKVNQSSHNVEETMIPHYRSIIESNLWEEIRDDWGTFLYGNVGEGPYVGHTDASKRYQGSAKSQPEINGETYVINNPL